MASLVEKSLMDKNLTSDLSNLAYFFIHGLSKKEARDCFKKKRKDFLGKAAVFARGYAPLGQSAIPMKVARYDPKGLTLTVTRKQLYNLYRIILDT